MHNNLQMNAFMSRVHMPYLECMHFGIRAIVVRTYKLYEHFHGLRCDSLMVQDTDLNKEFLTIKLKAIDLGVCLLPIIIG